MQVKSWAGGLFILVLVLVALSAQPQLNIGWVLADEAAGEAEQELRPDFYDDSCPQVFQIVHGIVQQAVKEEPRMAASLLRLHFHDCFVNGCDGSNLLDDTPSFHGEKNAAPNRNSLRGFEVVDAMKAALEQECPLTVSCADILAIAARDSVIESGGPWWAPSLGRRDSIDASAREANQALPGPTDTLDIIVAKFQRLGLSAEDVVVLSGAHTMGRAHCRTFSNRLYNFQNTASRRDPTLSSQYASHLEKVCPVAQGGNLIMVSSLDPHTPNLFDNTYYQNLLRGEGLLQSDQALFCSDSRYVKLYSLVSCYAHNNDAFFSDFANSMVKMGNISPLIGSHDGQIRKNCRFIDSTLI
ncbi:hypothetical protein GOP47_0015239 [Adiantum capillus-veneris]|uniref:Peroxidase n=1 Tax=Adiantum capillus-veneris TaxID=13818 RepID=A0A9D4UJ97_ADICA|nr:hypothetical protein GOP47_0015239 [Adiantum capillus-veneris]